MLTARSLVDRTAVRTDGDRSRGRTATGPLAGADMAGFVVWLAGQRVPLAQRTRVYREVEAFLAWQHTEFPDGVTDQRPTVWCYLLRRQHDGDREADVLKVWGALELLLTYAEARA